MSLVDLIYGQFKKPHGLLGSVVGHLMARKNAARGRWVIDLLEPRAGERILEVGFGPGADATRTLARVGAKGSLVGVDASNVMVRQAEARNQQAVAEGRATFVEADIAQGLPWNDDEFDAAYTINCALFWPNLEQGLRELQRVVRRGGRLIIAVQPRRRGATEADSDLWATRFTEAANDSGLRLTQIARGVTTPSTVAALLTKP